MNARSVCEHIFELTKVADYLINVNLISPPNIDGYLFATIFNAAVDFEKNNSNIDRDKYKETITQYGVETLIAACPA